MDSPQRATLSYYCVRCRCANVERPHVLIEVTGQWMDAVFCAWCKLREWVWSVKMSDRAFVYADLVATGEASS
jgi:hypothetical protein